MNQKKLTNVSQDTNDSNSAATVKMVKDKKSLISTSQFQVINYYQITKLMRELF